MKGKKESFESLSCESLYGFDGHPRHEWIVLDGQQRLTAMHYAFMGPKKHLPNRTRRALYYVRIDRFINEEYDEAFHYEWDSQRLQALFADQEALFERHMFPCSVAGAGGWSLYEWMQAYGNYWSAKAAVADQEGDPGAAADARRYVDNGRQFGDHVKDIIEKYQISYIELDEDLEIDKVCDIFTQLNSRGVRLDVFDLMNALLKPKELQLKLLWRQAAPRLEFAETSKMNVYVLQVMSILRQGYCSPKYLYFLLPGEKKPVRDHDGTRRREVLVPTVADFRKRWDQAVDALDDALDLLRHPQEFGAISAKYLPYTSILPVFAALQAHTKTLPLERQFDAQRKLRLWYWASVFTNRYSGSVESTSARDFVDVSNWMDGSGPEPWLVAEFKSAFRQLDLSRD